MEYINDTFTVVERKCGWKTSIFYLNFDFETGNMIDILFNYVSIKALISTVKYFFCLLCATVEIVAGVRILH